MDKDVCVVDYSWLYHKAFHTFRNLAFPVDGKLENTGVLYGVVRDLASLYDRLRCDMVLCLEPSSNSERYLLFPEYKKGRSCDGVYSLYQESLSAVSLLPYVRLVTSSEDGEADDVIYSYIFTNASEFSNFLVYGVDNDLLQISAEKSLLNKVFYYGFSESKRVSFESYCEQKYGVAPSSILLYRSFIGDSSDSIPSVSPRLNRNKLRSLVEGSSAPSDIKEKLSAVDGLLGSRGFDFSLLERNYNLMRLRVLPFQKFFPVERDVLYFVKKYGLKSYRKFFGIGEAFDKNGINAVSKGGSGAG